MTRRPLRILVSTGIFPNRVRGNRGIYNLRQAAALREECDVRVVTPTPYVPPMLSRLYRDVARVPRRDTIEDFDVIYPRYFVTPKVGRSLHGVFLYLSVIGEYRRLVREFRPDIMLGFFAYPYGFANVLIGRKLNIPVVTSCRGSDINLIARSRLRGKLIGWSLRRCSCVFSVSEALGKRIVSLGVDESRVFVVPNGIDPGHFRPTDRFKARRRLGLPEDGKVVVTVSRLGPEKGIDVLVRAFSNITDPDTRLVVVGDGPESQALEKLALKLGLNSRIHFVGDRPHEEVPAWIGACDVFALPSRFEGYPNALLESLACARPVVASRVGGVGEIVTSPELGLTVDPGDPAAFAGALEAALERNWDERALVAAGTRRTWETVAAEMIDIFKDIAGGENDPRARGALK